MGAVFRVTLGRVRLKFLTIYGERLGGQWTPRERREGFRSSPLPTDGT